MTDELISAKFKVDDKVIRYRIVYDYDQKDILRLTFEDKQFFHRIYHITKSQINGDFLVLPHSIRVNEQHQGEDVEIWKNYKFKGENVRVTRRGDYGAVGKAQNLALSEVLEEHKLLSTQ